MPWRGWITFGNGWAAYTGGSDQQSAHAHAALQMVVAHRGRVTVETCANRLVAPGIVIAPQMRHFTVPLSPPLTFVYAEAHSPLGRYLSSYLGSRRIAAAPARIVSLLRKHEPIDLALHRLISDSAVLDPLDSRLQRVLDKMEQTLEGPGAIARAAREASLSPSRLRAIAKAELGLPLARWLLWRKLARAAASVARGEPLANAAAAGGFADQAHFSRAMKQMFGITPQQASRMLRTQLGS